MSAAYVTGCPVRTSGDDLQRSDGFDVGEAPSSYAAGQLQVLLADPTQNKPLPTHTNSRHLPGKGAKSSSLCEVGLRHQAAGQADIANLAGAITGQHHVAVRVQEY